MLSGQLLIAFSLRSLKILQQATASPSDAYYYNQRQAMLWGQRWQPHPVALPARTPLRPRPSVIAAPSIIRETPVAAPSIRAPSQVPGPVDWSAPEMMQQPELDEVRRVSD